MLGWTTYLIKSVPVYRDAGEKVLYTKAQLETLGLDRISSGSDGAQMGGEKRNCLHTR
jgi:hypothetical protein